MKFINFFGLLILIQLTVLLQVTYAKKIETSKIVKKIQANKSLQEQKRNLQFYKAAGIIEAWGWDEFKDWCSDSYNKTKEWAKDSYEKGKDWVKDQKTIKQERNEQFYKAAGIIEAWGWDEFKDWCSDSYNKTKEWAKDSYEKGKDWVKDQKTIKQARSEQFNKAAGIIEAWGWDEFKDWCSDSYNKTKEWAKDSYEKGKDWVKDQKTIKQARSEQFNKAAGIIEAWGWDEFKDWCSDSYNKTKEWAKDSYEKGKDWVKDQKTIKQARNEQFQKAAGIIEAWGWDEFKDWCSDSYNKTKEWAKDSYEKGKDWVKDQKTIKQNQKQIVAFDVNSLSNEEIAELEEALEQITPYLTEAFDNGPEFYGQVKQTVLTEIQEQYGEEGVQLVHLLFEKFEIQYIQQKTQEMRPVFELAFVLGGKEELEAIEQEYLEALIPILEPAAIQEIEKFFDSIYMTQLVKKSKLLKQIDLDDLLEEEDTDSDEDQDSTDEELEEDSDSDDEDSEDEDSDAEEETSEEEQQSDVVELSSQQVLLIKEKNSGTQVLKPSVEMQTISWFNYLIYALALAFILFGLYKCFATVKNTANNKRSSKGYKLFKKETEVEEHFL